MNRAPDLYHDPKIASEFARVIRLYNTDLDKSVEESKESLEGDSLTEATEDFFQFLLEKTYNSLRTSFPDTIPALYTHTTMGPLDMLGRHNANAVFTDRKGVHVGLGLVGTLDAAILVLTGYLIENLLFQISPPMGPAPSIETIIDVDLFPAEAFKLYADHLIPEAEAEDGYRKRPFQFLMEYLQAARFSPHKPGEAPAPLSRVMPKPLLDLVEYFQGFDTDSALEKYLDPGMGPYAHRLHLQLLLDVLYFILAHEVAHTSLEHLSRRSGDLAQLREFEAAADEAALNILKSIPGFQLASLLFVFDFTSYIEPDLPTDQLDHPLARNRLLILADTLLRQQDNDELRATINAGLALLAAKLEPYPLTYGWSEDDPEDVDIFVSHYSDMDYTAHLLVYIDRPPRQVSWEDAWMENAFLLAHLTFDINFVLRDRLQMEQEYALGRVVYHPTIKPENLFISHRGESVYCRLHLPIPAPPEWFLGQPHAELAIISIDIQPSEPDIPDEGEDPEPVYFYYMQVEFDLDRFLRDLAPLSQNPTLRAPLLIAARRYAEYQRPESAISLYQWLYRQDPNLLTYGDLLSYCGLLLELERYEEAETVAVQAMEPDKPFRPGFHYFRAFCHISREEVQEAYEQVFLEMATIGEFGEFFEGSRSLLVHLMASHPDEPVIAELREYSRQVDLVRSALESDQPQKAEFTYRQAEKFLLAAKSESHQDYIFIRELLAEIRFGLCQLTMSSTNFEAARKAFEAILDRLPGFAPALTHLSRIALMEGDRQRARAIWKEAYRSAPFHNFVFELRDQVEDPNPNFYLTSYPIEAEEG